MLELGREVERGMAGGQTHSYSLALDAEHFVFAVVEQRGVDVMIAVFDPGGELIGEFDSPNGTVGVEPVSVFADAPGVYRLEVRTFEAGADPGRYAITVQSVEPQAATPSGQVDQLLAAWDRPGSPGMAVAVVKDGAIAYQNGYGEANLELGIPITPQSVFYLGSVSKQFVAMAIALLEQEGKLSFDDDIRKYVPEMPDYGQTITVGHLIHHTSGIRDYLGLMSLAGIPLGYFHSDAGVIELIARQQGLNFEPGDQYLYSNSGYFLLNVIVERASGQTLRDYAAEHIFGPLGMQHSHFHDDYQHLIDNRASSYFEAEGGYAAFLSTFDRVGSGGVYSSVEDLFLWDQNFYHYRVGGEEVFETLHQRGVLNGGREIDYAGACPGAQQAIDEHFVIYFHECCTDREIADIVVALSKLESAYRKRARRKRARARTAAGTPNLPPRQ